jgi:hypothetical protein
MFSGIRPPRHGGHADFHSVIADQDGMGAGSRDHGAVGERWIRGHVFRGHRVRVSGGSGGAEAGAPFCNCSLCGLHGSLRGGVGCGLHGIFIWLPSNISLSMFDLFFIAVHAANLAAGQPKLRLVLRALSLLEHRSRPNPSFRSMCFSPSQVWLDQPRFQIEPQKS